MNSQPISNYIRTSLIPLILMILCPLTVLFLSKYGHMTHIHMTWVNMLLGNATAWTIALILMVWALIFLKIPAKQHHGQTTRTGFTPRYQDNGFFYYITTCIAFIFACFIYNPLPRIIYLNVPYLISTLNMTALIFCGILWLKGKYFPYEKGHTEKVGFIFEYYCGLEHHPRIFDVDVKQFTNCRFGMMAWQLLVFAYWFFSFEQIGFNWGIFVCTVLQTVYAVKFYWWEVGYFNTIDVAVDSAGFYICWGCLVFLPGFYAFCSYYYVMNPPTIGKWAALGVLVFGLLCILLTYLIDHEKEIFINSKGEMGLWSNKPKFINAEYETKNGTRKTRLLVSGFWGVTRHFNYVWEIADYISWGLVGYNLGIWPFVNAIFVTVLLVHRTFRDDDKCSKKYGAAWQKYCSIIKYKMIPYVF